MEARTENLLNEKRNFIENVLKPFMVR
jgi:hypothetical protein